MTRQSERFTRDRYARRVYAVKGRPGQTPIWPRMPSRKNQTPFFMVGVDAAKTAIYDRLARPWNTAFHARPHAKAKPTC
jgi:phage terminase large subunit GpA-like protein